MAAGLSLGAKRALLAVSTFLALCVIFAIGFEALATLEYGRWRSTFDNEGNFGRITVPSPNPVLLWEYKPYGERPDRPVLRTNRYGFRDRDLDSKAKPPGITRVAFIGDSVTLGLWVPEARTFVRRFEVRANRRDKRPVEALNFGIDGYNTVQIHELLRTKVLHFQPDAVVYTFTMNDFDFDDSSGLKILYFKKPRSFLLQRLRHLWMRLRGVEFHHYYFERNRDRVFRELLGMRDLLEERDISFFVAIVPIFVSFRAYPLADLHEALDRYLDANGIVHLDLLDAFRSAGAPAGRFASDLWHPNETGHRVIARALLDPVLDLGGCPEPLGDRPLRLDRPRSVSFALARARSST